MTPSQSSSHSRRMWSRTVLMRAAVSSSMVTSPSGRRRYLPEHATRRQGRWGGEPRVKPYERLQRFWIACDDIATTTAPRTLAVTQLEERYGVVLPADFRDYLIHACPVSDL